MSYIEDFKDSLNPPQLTDMQSVLGFMSDPDPKQIAQQCLSGLSKIGLGKETALGSGITSFKSKFALPIGRIDGGGGVDMGKLQQDAVALKQKSVNLNTQLQDFISANPAAAFDPQIQDLQTTLTRSAMMFDGTVGDFPQNQVAQALAAEAKKTTDAEEAITLAEELKPIFEG